MTMSCVGCGFACDFDFAFCPRCGMARAAKLAEPEADRRQVTVLFADLTGFTSLAERLDPETVRAFQNALFEAMAQAIQHYDGFVEKFIGDAVLAVFGAPRAHEDDPLRALEAAQQMMQRVDGVSRQWVARLGRTVTLHIGIHTGAVVAGSLGSGAGGTYAVTGDTVNTAARLLAAAEPGSVLVSQATQALVQHRFAFAPATELALRGRAEPVRVHRLVGVRSDAAPARGLAELGLVAPLVGRSETLAQLLHAFDRMQHGRAQFVCVVGEAGAGKSRLLDELCTRLLGDPRFATTALRRASCSALGEPTYGTFSALFREAYRVDEADSLALARSKLQQGLLSLGADAAEADSVAQVLDVLLGIQEARPRDIEPAQLQRQITLAARALVERRLAQQPLMIVVDDLQWADAASVDLLRKLVDELAERPLMLLVLQRPDARVTRCLRAECTMLELGPLGDAATRALVDHLLGAAAGDGLAPLRDVVVQRAGGNPLFVEEIVRSLAARGVLVRRQDRWVCEAGCDTAHVPPTLYGLLLSRVDGLAAEDRRTLQEAAVLGAEFDAALLHAIASDPRSAGPALQRLVVAELIRAEGSGGQRWRFAHALLHEVVYQNLLLARRTELHERAGRALEAAGEAVHEVAHEVPVALDSPARSPHRLAELEALGHHWSLSPDKLRGARYLLAAGDWARAVYANDDAIRHYERALGTLAELVSDAEEPAVEAARLDLRERLADLLGLQGRRTDALAHYDAVQQAAEGQGDAVRAARLLRKIGGQHWEAGERERASACFHAGLERLGDGGDALERAYLLQEMGRLAFRAGDNATALALAERALAELPAEQSPLADDTHRPPAPVAHDPAAAPGERAREAAVVLAQACNTLGIALARLGRSAEAVAQIERSVRVAESNDMLQAACRGYTNLGVLYASLDPPRSIQTCLRGLETAKKVGDLGFQSHLYANLAVAYCALTNRCEAEGIEAAHAAASLDRRLGLLDHLAVPLIVLGQIHQCHGDHVRAFASYEEALLLAEQIDEPQLLFPCYDGLATLHLDAGRPTQAERYLRLARAVCERAGLEPDALMVLPFLC
ncbi:adenylate/guanylate cyclase domain-containing protein [Aquabacterium sp.]|uniref:adenylate/guanylate cyclase domain-containing protein n=1 Tax=Aquabacterium sp. TaxID=1872578 RepID=UPI002C9C3BE6|nr:adenylate/guanylate cyclase domain-containing protein [Aquabacterium sp.]HSW05908.1 adenylate/guanylate cyclase domain-containing protein [Aquabacterium sp.]